MSRAHLTPVDVIDAGVSIADREGFDAVSLAGVARRLGVRTPSLYTHVRDLSALRDGISQRALGDLGARIGIAVAGNAGVTALRARPAPTVTSHSRRPVAGNPFSVASGNRPLLRRRRARCPP